MANGTLNAGTGGFETKPTKNRGWIRVSCNSFKFTGCTGYSGVAVPRQIEYDYCVGPKGEEIRAYTRRPDPQRARLETNRHFQKVYNLIKMQERSDCPIDILLGAAMCEDQNQLDNPYASDFWTLLAGVHFANANPIGNDTHSTINPNGAGPLTAQLDFEPMKVTMLGKPRIAKVTATEFSACVTSFAVVDEGKCANMVCNSCDVQGCQHLFAKSENGYEVTRDGGKSIVGVPGYANPTGHAWANAFNGIYFTSQADRITLDASPTCSECNGMISAETDVPFVNLTNIVQVDRNMLVVAGGDGKTWRSVNGGYSWYLVCNNAPVDFLKLDINPQTNRLFAIGHNQGAVSFLYSDNFGKYWHTISPSPLPDIAYVSGASSFDVLAMNDATYFVINGKLFKTACHECQTLNVVKLGSPCAADTITNLGTTDKSLCGIFFAITATPTGIARLYWTLEGGMSWSDQIGANISGASPVTNPMAICSTQYGESLMLIVGKSLYHVWDWDSFFKDPATY